MKKRLKEEVRDPQEGVDKDITSAIEKSLSQYMTRLGWTNEDFRQRFISTITSFLVSGKGTNKQRLIVSYLEKGLQVLNLEISKEQISIDSPDDTDLKSDAISESINKGFDTYKKIKVALLDSQKNLINRKYSLDEAKDISLLYFKSNGKRISSLKNLKSINEQNVDAENKDVYLTNFTTFLRLYLTREYNWSTETVNNVIDIMIDMVEKTGGDANLQERLNRRIEDLERNIGTTMSLDKSPEESKNLEVARSEFRKFAVGLNNWSGKLYTPFFNSLLKLFVNSKNVNIQRILVNKLSEINSALPSKKQNKEKETKNKEEEEGGD